MDGCPHHGVTDNHQGECRGAALVELEVLPGATRAEKKSEAKQYNSTSIKQTVAHAYTPIYTRLQVHGIHGWRYMVYTVAGTWYGRTQRGCQQGPRVGRVKGMMQGRTDEVGK